MSPTLLKETDVFHYRRGKAEIRPSSHTDILPIAFNMRQADQHEVWASHNHTPHSALQYGLVHSRICLTALHRGVPVAMFGVVPVPRHPNEAIVWFLATPVVDDHRLSFGVMGLAVVKYFFTLYDSMYNWVDERNVKSIEWLEWMGATFLAPAPYGPMGLPFRFFQLKGKENV